jgi:hypothetical protein
MQRNPEIEDLTRQLYRSVTEADPSFFQQRLSQGESCVVIGTAPGEWWNTYDAALEAIAAQMAATGAGAIEIIAGEMRGYRQGDIGWVADQPTLRIGGAAVQCRHTSVFVQAGGEWRIVQHHFSIGVPNEDVFGKEAARLG